MSTGLAAWAGSSGRRRSWARSSKRRASRWRRPPICPTGRGVFYAPTGADKGLLCVYDLPALPDDRTYQAWLVRDGQRTNAGTFRVSGDGYGVLLVRAGQPLESFDSLGITEEPAGGSAAPTGPRLMGGKL